MGELRESRTLAEALRHQARLRPGKTALVSGERATSYGDLDRRADRVANGLAALGLRRGDRVGYLGKNSDLYFELLFGAARAGVALVPVNWRLAAPEVAAVLADAGVSALFLGRGYDAAAEAPGMPAGLRCVAMDGAPDGRWPGFEAWRDAQPATDPGVPVEAEDTALQMYTSGTTGRPKGVELSHRNFLAFLAAAEEGGCGAIAPEEVVLMCMPAFHVSGTNVGLLGLTRGAEVVVMEEFDPAGLAALVPRRGVTWLVLVPAAILALLNHPAAAGAEFGSVRSLVYGASPIAEALVERAGRAFPNAALWQLYGLTEATAAGTILPPEAHDPARGKLRSCGLPYPGLELRVVDPQGAPVPAGAVGEIVLRSAMVMKGYWNQPEATRAAFLPGGWLRTGDAGYLAGRGRVRLRVRPGEGHDRQRRRERLPGGGGERAVRPPGGGRRGGDRRARRAVGRGGEGDRGAAPRGERLGGGAGGARAGAHRRLQAAEVGGLRRGAAAQSRGQGPAPGAARAVLGRPRPPGGLMPPSAWGSRPAGDGTRRVGLPLRGHHATPEAHGFAVTGSSSGDPPGRALLRGGPVAG
jgi:fatty-acyl-CoA synthase